MKNLIVSERRTDKQTDGRTDRQTDGRTYKENYRGATILKTVLLATDGRTDRRTDKVRYRLACYTPNKKSV